MTITEEEGKQLAAKFMSAFSEGFIDNNHGETMKDLFADKISLSWSDGTKGDRITQDFMKTMKEGWGTMDSYIFCKPLVCVDTNQSRIAVSAECVFNIKEGGLVAIDSVFILILNDDKRVVSWSAVWDPNNKQLLDAVAKATKKLGKKMPALGKEEIGKKESGPKEPTMPITVEEGRAFVTSFLKVVADGFRENNHTETFTDFLADKLSWDWSDGTKGEGSYDEIMKICTKNWSSMVDSFVYSDPTIAVDTDRSVIVAAFQLCINVTGGLSDENNPVQNNVVYVYHLNKEKKCIKWHMCWNHNKPELQAAFAKVMKKLEAVEKVPMVKAVPTPGFTTGEHVQQDQ